MFVQCPRCKRKISYEGNPYRPFCGERCKSVDLGNWLSESYRIPTSTSQDVSDEVAEPDNVPLDETERRFNDS